MNKENTDASPAFLKFCGYLTLSLIVAFVASVLLVLIIKVWSYI